MRRENYGSVEIPYKNAVPVSGPEDVYKRQRIIRMRGRIMQEQPYYVYIRKEVRGAGEMVFYTTVYLCACCLLYTSRCV